MAAGPAAPPAFETLEIPVGTMTFRARAAGPQDGRLVMLLHGFPQTSLEWRHQLTALADAGYRAVAPDQRGYSPGARPEGVDHYQGRHLVADVIAMADWLGGHQIDLVGHDWGGMVAWRLAGEYPERLRSLAVVSTPHPSAFAAALAAEDDDQRTRSGYIAVFQQAGTEDALTAGGGAGLRALFEGSGLHDVPEEYINHFTEPGAMTAALNWYRAVSFSDAGDAKDVSVPTLYVWSDQDIALGRAAAEATGAHCTGPYRFEVLPGVSHWVPDEAPGELNRLLLEHLASVD